MVTIVVAQLDVAGPALVQRVLRDWAAAGLVGDILWVDSNQKTDVLFGTLIEGSSKKTVEIRRWVAENDRTSDSTSERKVFPAYVLDVWGWQGQPGMADASAVQEWTKTWLPGGAGLHVLAVPYDISNVPTTAIPKWTDVIVLSCLDSSTPSTHTLAVRSDDPDFITHTAAGLASVASLWSWCDPSQGFTGSQNQLAVSKARVTRSFIRVIDSRPLFQSVLSEVEHTVHNGLPVAIDYSGQQRLELPQVPRERGDDCVQVLADAVLDKNANVARFTRPEMMRDQGAASIGFWSALKHYFSYLGEAIRQLPGDIVRSITSKVEQKVVGFGQSLYGNEARWQVVLNDTKAWQNNQLGAILAQMSQEILKQENLNWSPAPPQTSTLWTDTFQVGCGLVDGEAPGSPELTKVMPRQGDSSMVLTYPDLIAPDPDGAPCHIDEGSWTVDVTPLDPMGARMVDRTLAQTSAAEQDPARKARLDSLRATLGEWIRKQRSFAWDVGWGIAGSLMEALDCQASLTQGMDESESDKWERALEKSVRSLKVRSVVTLCVTILGLVGLGFIFKFHLLSLVYVIAAGVGWLIVMFIVTVISCMKQINTRFKAENALRGDPWNRKDGKRIAMNHVAQEIMRLSNVVDQTPSWICLMGELAHRTGGFGSHKDSQSESTSLTGNLPLEMQVAQVRYVPDVETETGRRQMALAYSAKARLLSVGWFTQLAQSRIRMAGRQWCARHGVDEDDIVKQVMSDSEQRNDGPLHGILAQITEESNRNQSTFADQLSRWARGEGSTQWQQALQGAQMVAGVGAAFDAQSFFSDILSEQNLPFRDDFSALGQGRGTPGRITNLFPPTSVGLNNDQSNTFMQALCRVLTTPMVDPGEELRCCENNEPVPGGEEEQTIFIPRFSQGGSNA